MLSGVVPIIKPPGLTSQQAVSIFRKLAGVRKAGHTGTLDPPASGLLVVCFGQATKLIEYVDKYPKKYRAEITLGWSTDTQDSTGRVVREFRDFRIEPDEFDAVLSQFVGQIEQTPPMVSAVKHAGVRLYELARRGETVNRSARPVTIYSLSRFKPDSSDKSSISETLTFGSSVMLDIECSSGTYIRTLCEDIGVRLGVPAHMSYLVRLATSGFTLEDAVTLEEVEQLPPWGGDGQRLRSTPRDRQLSGGPPFPMSYLIRHMPKLHCLPHEDRLISNGVVPKRLCRLVAANGVEETTDDLFSIFLSSGELGAIARVSRARRAPRLVLEKVMTPEV